MTPDGSLRAAEWRAHWPLIVTAFVGLSLTSVIINSTGLVIEPLEREFGWSRTQVTAGTSLATLLAIHWGQSAVVVLAAALYLVAAGQFPGDDRPDASRNPA